MRKVVGVRKGAVPAAGVVVQMGAGEALVFTAGSQDPPGLIRTAHLDPGQI